MLCIGGEPIGNVDHRGGATLRQPAPSSDPRFRASIAIPQLLRHALALPETLERERCTTKISGDPQGIALARAAPPDRPLGGAEHADVDAVALGARQIATENARAEIVRHPRDAGHDLDRRIRSVLPIPRWHAERDEEAEGRRAIGGEVGKRRARGTVSDLLEVEPVGAEMDALERCIDADGQCGGAERNERAVVTEALSLRRQLGDTIEYRADAIEFFARTQVHLIRTKPLSVAAHT